MSMSLSLIKEAKECSCLSGALVNQWVICVIFFHWLSFGFFFDVGVDVVQNLLADLSEFTFCGIYEAADRVDDEVIFMVFQSNKRLLFCLYSC